MKVLHMSPFKDENELSLKRKTDDSIEIIEITPEEKEKAIERAGEFDVVIGARIPREFLEKAVNLDYFIIPFVGIPPQDKETLPDFPNITVLNSHFNYWMVAEHALALLLTSVKNIIPIHQKMKKGDWTPRYEHQWSRSLRDKNLLLLGFGEIGEEIARLLKPFKMNIKAVKKSPGESDLVAHMGTNNELHDLLPEADYIICTLPETESTKGYLGEEEFELMKVGVHIVNVGRGPVIDEEALYNSLESGKVGGAALDTWWIYPPDEESRDHTFPSNYPLDEFENVIFSPHRSTHIKEREKYRIEDLADTLNKLVKGEEVNVVDIKEGY
ncbi:MAG: 2-hydroxyacid dehydrogenase [Thermoplasmata archaeon]